MRKKLYNINYSSSPEGEPSARVEKPYSISSRLHSKNNIYFSRSLNGGFSLAELIVVIAIIAILMAISIIGLDTYQARGRDSRRKADLAKFSAGMTSFYAQNKIYPNPGMNDASNNGIDQTKFPGLQCATYKAVKISGFGSVNKCLRYLGYMDKLTVDPLAEDDATYKYRYAVLADVVSWEASAQFESMGEQGDCSGASCDDYRYETGSATGVVDTSGESYSFDGTAYSTAD